MTDTDEKNQHEQNKSGIYYVKNHLNKLGHVYALVIIFAFTIATRLQGFQNLQKENGEWLFIGNDSWYHLRATMFNVENFPFPIGFDAKTGYPNGSDPGTFGTLFDFVHATVAMIIGLGDPSPELVQTILAVSSPVLSGIAVIVVYFLGKYITDSRFAGVFSSIVLALIPGTFYARGTVGFAQHHIAETILLMSSLLLVMKTISKAEDDLIIAELIKNREFSEVKSWLLMVGLSAIMLFMYYLTWPPAIMLFGLIGIAGVLYSIIGFSNRTAQSAALTFSILTGLMTLMIIVSDPTSGSGIAKPSILHLAVATSAFVFNTLSWIGLRKADKRDLSRTQFVGVLVGIGIVGVGSVLVLQPSIIDRVFGVIFRLLGYPFGLGGGQNVQTIAEERSASLANLTFRQYGLMLYAAFAGIILAMLSVVTSQGNKRPFSDDLLFLVVAVFILMISIGTVRFNYYLAPFIAVLGSITVLKSIRFVDLPETPSRIQGYHFLAGVLILMLIVPVLVVSIPVNGQQSTPVFTDAVSEASYGGYAEWEEPLNWLSNNTAHDGVGQYEQISEPYEYPNESYGVMSWWDYGHWITVTGERTPVANPFQQNAQDASEFLLAQNPKEAEQVMEDLEEGSEARYVVIDWQMASPISKYPAIESFNPDINDGESYRPYYATPPGQSARLQFFQRNQLYYESMLGRLYTGHGSAMEASSTTIDYSTVQSIRTVQPATNPITRHNSTEEAREYAQSETQVSRGGIFGEPPERVEALDHYRLVKAGEGRSYQTREIAFEALNLDSATQEDLQVDDYNEVPSTVKIFERVDGANIEINNVDSNETMRLEVDVSEGGSTPVQLSRFTYTQRVKVGSDGTVEATVPYSNTGYDDAEYPPEVRGVSQYRLVDSDGNVVTEFDVSENDVVKEDSETIQVNVNSDSK